MAFPRSSLAGLLPLELSLELNLSEMVAGLC
jgi:hypothetical protein